MSPAPTTSTTASATSAATSAARPRLADPSPTLPRPFSRSAGASRAPADAPNAGQSPHTTPVPNASRTAKASTSGSTRTSAARGR
jgi:hypothetical protein